MDDTPLLSSSSGTLIDWNRRYSAPEKVAIPVAASRNQDWQGDFVTQLGRSDAERNPNASLRLQINVAPKLKAELSSIHSGV
jgi:hypothetical protein